MTTKRTRLSPPPPEAAASKVLGDDDLLREILLRLDFPTCLVRAALVCKRWLRRASDPAFLRRFRALHPPRLLGLYVVGDSIPRPEFVPMPQPPELAAVVRSASFGFDASAEFESTVYDCRNGRVLIQLNRPAIFRHAVRSPLLQHPERDMTVLLPPSPPTTTLNGTSDYIFLPEDGGDGASYYHVDLAHSDRKVSAQVSVLQSGAWTVHAPAAAELPTAPDRIPYLILLAGGKLYMVTVAGYILVFHLDAASFSVIELPDGVHYEYYGNLVLSRGHNSGDLYLFHVEGFQLHVWHCRTGDHGGAAEWVLVDTICVRKACGHLVQEGLGPAQGHTAIFSVVGVGDNAEFVFLELEASGIVVYMHLGSRTVEKVYQRDPDNDELIQVYPFVMVWPPVFPALDGAVHQE